MRTRKSTWMWIATMLATVLAFLLVTAVSADWVSTEINRVFLDPESASAVANGYQTGDVISYIIETTPRDVGSDFGAAAWMTVYIPPRVEVVGSKFVVPDGDGTYSAIPAEDTSPVAEECGPRGCALPTGGTYQNGHLNEGQQDTGIFYSTDPQTALLSTPLTIETLGSSKNGLQNVYNQWTLSTPC